MSKNTSLEDIEILRSHRKVAQKKAQEKKTQERRDAIAKGRVLKSKAVKVQQGKKNKPILPEKKPVRTHSLDLQKILQSMTPNAKMSPHDIAMAMHLDFSRDSHDRRILALAINELLDNHVITEVDGGKFVKRSLKKPDLSNDIIGVLHKNGDESYVKSGDPDQPKYYVGACDYPDQSIVSIKPHENSIDNRATITHYHGDFDQQHGISRLTAIEHDIPIEFPEDVLEEVIGMKVPNLDGRRDFRHIPFITIDPETAKDFDDAICVRKRGKNWEIYVAIADVEHYVRPGTRLFEEAYRRGNSIYFPGFTIPMIPEVLSNGLCSLKPNEDRACIVAKYTVDSNGNIVKKPSIERGLMRSRARLTYEEVDAAIAGDAPKEVMSLYNRYISKAHKAYKNLLKERQSRGALDLNTATQHIDIAQETGVTVKLERPTDSHGIIEELMIGANRVANHKLKESSSVVFSRVHGEPNLKALEATYPILEKMGIEISPELPCGELVKDILRQAETNKNRDKIRRMMVLVQDRAKYQAKAGTHYGLGLTKEGEGYSHFTSPIRRFSDLIVHSLLMKRPTMDQSFFSQDNLGDVANHLNKTQQRSREAERKCRERYAAAWVEDNLSKTFNAKVTNVDFPDNQIEVRVDGRSIYTTVSVSNGQSYKKFDSLKIRPIKADKITGQIEFRIVSDSEGVQKHKNVTAQQAQILSKKQPRTKQTRYRHHA